MAGDHEHHDTPRPAGAGVPPDERAVPGDHRRVPAHRTGRTLADLVPALVARLAPEQDGDDGGGDDRSAPADDLLGRALPGDRVVVLVVDGLGARQLDRHARAAPLLTSLPGGEVDATFPTTTVTSLASLGTGTPPAQHGLVGYAWPVAGHEHPLNALTWRIGLRGGGFDARATVVPESLVPAPTAFERAAAAGIATTVVVRPEFLDSGLTRAVLRGGERRAAATLDTALRTAVEAVTTADGPALAYAHHGDVDTRGHVDGPGTASWLDALADVDRALTALRAELPADVTVLVTADHGMVGVPDRDVVELADRPALAEGVRVLAGEPRVRHLALEDDADPAAVADRWRAALGADALVVTRDQALPWFGPDPDPRATAAIGDLLVLARRGILVHAEVDPRGGRLRGHHGGPTVAERLVPLRHLEAAR